MKHMKLLLIGTQESAAKADDYYDSYIDVFRHAISEAGIEGSIDFTYLDDLALSAGDGKITASDTTSGNQLNAYDMIFIRGLGLRQRFDELRLISAYARENKIKLVNDYASFRDSSKLGQAVTFHETGLPVASSVFVNRAVLAGKVTLPFEFPCIMKATFGAHGNDNYFVKSLEEVREIQAQSSGKRFVLQRFVKNEGDFRILIVGQDVTLIGRRAVEGSHLNNTSQGADAEIIAKETVNPEMIADAKKIAGHLGMTIAGVDAIIDTDSGEYFFLEVNSQPQIMSGAFLDVKASMLASLLAHESGE